jgi:hypothetical protein
VGLFTEPQSLLPRPRLAPDDDVEVDAVDGHAGAPRVVVHGGRGRGLGRAALSGALPDFGSAHRAPLRQTSSPDPCSKLESNPKKRAASADCAGGCSPGAACEEFSLSWFGAPDLRPLGGVVLAAGLRQPPADELLGARRYGEDRPRDALARGLLSAVCKSRDPPPAMPDRNK